MFKAGLTDEQARNIATDEDVTLVLAGAGTGKTAVITGKIAHLVRNQGMPPESILALAFNRKAALEIRERLPDDLKGAQVSTFHSFALKVVASSGTAPTISKLAQDQFAYTKALDGILARMIADPRKAKAIIEMITSFSAEYREPFEFSNRAEYARYVQDAEPRTLNGELVKSFEELMIANFLAVNGVAYTYEKPYEFPTSTRERRQYQPDFFLPDHRIYIEHFAPQCSVQHGPQHQGAGSRLCRSARPEGQPVRLPGPGRGRPAAWHCDASHTWVPLPVRRGEAALLCGPDQGQEGGVPRRRPG